MNSEKNRKQQKIVLLDTLCQAIDTDPEVIEAMTIEEVRTDLRAMGLNPNEGLPDDLKRMIAAQPWKRADAASAQPADQASKQLTGAPGIAQSGDQSLEQPVRTSAQWRMDVEIGRDHKYKINKISYCVTRNVPPGNRRQTIASIGLMKTALAAALLIFAVYINVTFLPRLFQSQNQQIVRQPQIDDHKQPNSSIKPNESGLNPSEATVLPRATTPTSDQAKATTTFVGYPESYRLVIETALTSGRIEIAPVMRDLAEARKNIMGASSSENTSFRALVPNGTVVRTVRPTLRWQPSARGSQYIVKIYDDTAPDTRRYDPVDETKVTVTETMWVPSRPLKRGHIYVWQVNVAGEQIVGNKTPVFAKGKFKILARTELNELSAAEQVEPRSHIAMGVLYARLGLLDEAERELKTASLQDGQAKVLLRNLQQRRRKLHGTAE